MKLLIDIDKERYTRIIEHFDAFTVAMKYWGVESIKEGKIIQTDELNTNILDKIILEIEDLKNVGSYDEHLFYYNYGLNTAIKIINIYKNKENKNDTIH